MEFLGTLLTGFEQLKGLWSSISNFFNYDNILDKNLTTLRGHMERLECREKDMKTELEIAQHRRKRPRVEVENWLKDVQKMKDVAERTKKEAVKRRRFSRLGFLQDWEKDIETASQLVDQASFPNGILIDVKDEGMTLPTKELIGESTAKRNLEKIWTCLEKGEAQSIGVYGMGGIGKTTVVTHINNLLLEKKDTFGPVYWVTVSGDSGIRRLQDEIALKINLDLSKIQDKMIRHALLFEKLQEMGKFVLIFDDMWEVYPPEDVGIPIGADAGTLIITSRSREVCQKMGCQEIIKVDSLHEEEAWELFNKMLKRHGELCPKEEEIAKDVVKECAGLPLAIVTTARSLSVVYDIAEWRNALNELREHVKGHTIDIENDVFKILEFSYHRLNDDKIRECLLYCALFPEDSEIRRLQLIKYWIAEGLIEEMGSRQAERDRGHALLNKLENACLLERWEDGKAVRMHDVIRDMAINIARKNSRFMVKTGRGMAINIARKNSRFMVKTGRNWEDLSSGIVWSSNLERASFFYCKISSLTFEPKCPKLSTMFLLSCNFLLEDVPMTFFKYTTGLRVLDLSYSFLPVLPEPIYDLVNLRALILCGCKRLKHVGSLEKLKELRMLDFSRTGIETMPHGIEKLLYLKQFNWTSLGSKNGEEAVFDPLPKFLSNLVHLQCLTILDERVREIGAEELGRLTKLEILCTKFSSLHNFNSYMGTQHYRRLTHYDVYLIAKSFGLQSCKEVVWYCRQVYVIGCNLKEGTEDNDGCQLVLPNNLQALYLERCHLPTNLFDVSPSLKKMKDLEKCRIKQCVGIEYLCWVEDWIASINTLYLKRLASLGVLFKQRRTGIGRSCCWNLKHLEVRECGNLKHLFMVALVKYHLQNLVTLDVANCDQMEDIIEAEEEEEEDVNAMDNFILSLPNLQRLKLVGLQDLKSIWKGIMTCGSLQQLTVIDCPKLRRLPISVHVSAGDGETTASNPPLQRIQGGEEWWNRVEWDPHPLAKSLFQPMFRPLPKHINTSFLLVGQVDESKNFELEEAV